MDWNTEAVITEKSAYDQSHSCIRKHLSLISGYHNSTMIDEIVPILIEIDKFDVISSGTLISFANNEVKIIIGSSSPISIILAFNDSEDGGDFMKGKWTGQVLSPSSVKFTLHNFTNPLGSYPSDRVKIGIFQGRELFLDLLVHHHSGSDNKSGKTEPRKVVHYSIFMGNPTSQAQQR